MKISSPEFQHYGEIPKKFTGEGQDISPTLVFEGTPDNAKVLALIVDDPDAPMGTFDHWIAWNIPANIKTLEENAKVPKQGKNHFRELSYRGPMPPPGHGIHRYHFKVYALDSEINIPEGVSKEEVEIAIKPHILDQAELIGTYKRG